jgi:EAL domain-containing protein (putative c-di-GMP-specific phosphodiesterase class I)
MRSERDAESPAEVRDDDLADPLDAAVDAATIALRDAVAAAESAADTNLAAGEAATANAEAVRHTSVATATAVAAAASSTAQVAARTAAALDAESVNLAADVAARSLATESSAALVAADMAAASGRIVATSSRVTEVAANVAVGSATRVADLAPRLRAIAALRRVSLAPPPLVAELTDALARDELRLHYQPIYDMQSGALTAVEALLRWQHPSRGLLTPAVFLHLAEAHPDLVTPIGDWVLATALTEAQTWHQSIGPAAPKMWLNISCDQLGTGHVPALVERLLSAAGLAPSALGMEVTERQLVVMAGEAGQDLLDLQDLGVSLAVDDFGTGYASLDYLRWGVFDEIKIDRSFVAGLGRDRTDTAITSSIIALAQSLDLNVVAEGVETQDQYDRLKQLGCAMCQGYFLHRPAAPDVVGRLLGVLAEGGA